MAPKALIALAQQLNRESNLPGNCKASTLELRAELAAVVLGDLRLAVDIEALVVEALNPQQTIIHEDEQEQDQW